MNQSQNLHRQCNGLLQVKALARGFLHPSAGEGTPQTQSRVTDREQGQEEPRSPVYPSAGTQPTRDGTRGTDFSVDETADKRSGSAGG